MKFKIKRSLLLVVLVIVLALVLVKFRVNQDVALAKQSQTKVNLMIYPDVRPLVDQPAKTIYIDNQTFWQLLWKEAKSRLFQLITF